MRKSCQFLLIIEQRNCINIMYFGEAKSWPKVENNFIKEQSKCEGSPCTWMIDKISTSNGKLTPSVAAAALQLGIFVWRKRRKILKKIFKEKNSGHCSIHPLLLHQSEPAAFATGSWTNCTFSGFPHFAWNVVAQLCNLANFANFARIRNL